ncbi:hypothetical protein [Caldanaerobacter subterraneus]|uniref:Uncharacterized protein n=1 Tax=Caldanaerobacter subterraneus TaxID=911092 RepID=A0A7Y2PKP9_9THEO|nr:hypothetical protein [Caldanaerobacter subterraneus]NNG66411.1 hypothetical protein [Caldanaerobacter subterraneus]
MQLSASQIIYKALYNQNPTISGGICRLCGGPLLGNYRPYHELSWIKWTNESFNKNNTSIYVCEACQLNRDFRNTDSLKIGKGFIATEQSILFFEDKKDALKALYSLPEPPFVLSFITTPSRSPLTFYLPVSYSKQMVNALVAFNRGRIFSIPPVKKGGKWRKIKPVADEIYSITFDVNEVYKIIDFFNSCSEEEIALPEIRDLCLFDPLWGLCAWLTDKDKRLYSTILK